MERIVATHRRDVELAGDDLMGLDLAPDLFESRDPALFRDPELYASGQQPPPKVASPRMRDPSARR